MSYLKKRLFLLFNKKNRNYLKPTEACHTKANKRNKTGITGKTSTSGLKARTHLVILLVLTY